MLCYRGFAALLSCAACVTDCLAGGFQLSQQSATSTGRSLGGAGVAGDDLADIFFNPAAATFYQSQAQMGGVYLVTNNRFDDGGSFVTLGGVPGPATGPSDSIDETALTPSLYYVFPKWEAFSFGIAVVPTFGLGIGYDRNWVGRYHGVDSRLRVIDINPVVAYRVSPYLSLGAGLIYQTADATLSQAVFTGPMSADGYAKMEGDDANVGFSLGALYQFGGGLPKAQGTRVGLSLRSGVDHTLEGKRRLSGTGPADGVVGASARLKLPETVYLGVWHPVSDDLSLSFAGRWTNWSRHKEIRVNFDDGSPDSVTPQNWDDGWMIGVGANYAWDERLTVRGGLGLDKTPIPNRTLRSPRNPDADTLWLSLGASYKLGGKNAIDMTYVAWRNDRAPIATTTDLNPLAPGTATHTLVGEYDATVIHAVGLQYRHVFD